MRTTQPVSKDTALSVIRHYKDAVDKICEVNKDAQFGFTVMMTIRKGSNNVNSSGIKSILETLDRALRGFDDQTGATLDFDLKDKNSLEIKIEEEAGTTLEAAEKLKAGVQDASAKAQLQAVDGSNTQGRRKA